MPAVLQSAPITQGTQYEATAASSSVDGPVASSRLNFPASRVSTKKPLEHSQSKKEAAASAAVVEPSGHALHAAWLSPPVASL